MGEVADRITRLRVRVTSPDGNLRAALQSGDDITVEFRPNCYKKYTEPELQRQIAQLATLLYTGHARGFGQIMDEFDISLKKGPADASSPAERDFLKERNDLQVVGATPRKLVRLKATGLAQWECRIAEGTLAKLSEEQFLSELHGAVRNFLDRFNGKMYLLKDKHFNLELPKKLKERMARDFV